jgi:hypothetical protein
MESYALNQLQAQSILTHSISRLWTHNMLSDTSSIYMSQLMEGVTATEGLPNGSHLRVIIMNSM